METNMKTVTLRIDGKDVVAEEGMSVLQAARSVGIEIPSLCEHEAVKPAGVCRICMVEVQKGKRKRLVASCVYTAEEGIVVTTSNDKIRRNRRMLIELLWPAWVRMGDEYGIKESRFEGGLADCSLCGLCVRYCQQVAKKNAVYFKGRGIHRRIAFTPGLENECASCRQCFFLCTGGWLVGEHGVDRQEKEEEKAGR